MPVRCLNCPSKPEFPDMTSFVVHWNATHTVSMSETISLPPDLAIHFPDLQAKKINHYEVIP